MRVRGTMDMLRVNGEGRYVRTKKEGKERKICTLHVQAIPGELVRSIQFYGNISGWGSVQLDRVHSL